MFKEAFSSFAVTDLDAAEKFYGEVLDLEVTKEDMGFLSLAVGGHRVMIYPKDDHVPAVFTVLNFPVENVESTVEELTSRGVTFERYEGFDQDDKGIAGMGPEGRIAWFTDPSGNILAVVQMP